MTPFEGTSTCIETARPLQLLEVLSSVCALVFLSSRSLTSLQTSGGPLTSSRITPDSLLPFVHPPPLSSPIGTKKGLGPTRQLWRPMFGAHGQQKDEHSFDPNHGVFGGPAVHLASGSIHPPSRAEVEEMLGP